jgi:alpha-glucosidase
MTYSISSIFNFNMFGIPVSGPDTCGTYEDTSLPADEQEELCARWIQLASFYPLARQNQALEGGGEPNEPYRMNSTHQAWVKNALHQRLNFARQMYMCLYAAS